jgi:hypothetical protein
VDGIFQDPGKNNGKGGGSSSSLFVNISAQTTLTVKLLRNSDGAVLATYTSPTYDAVPLTDPFSAFSGKLSAPSGTSPLGFIFRLAESYDTVATDPSLWLTTAGQDPRSTTYPAAGLTTAPKSTNPTDCLNFDTISSPSRFFDRDISTGTSYNEDVPLYELPRSPILSLGELQHFYVSGARPFSIGNSWGNQTTVNSISGNGLFDRFYFSGLSGSIAPDPATQSLPSPLLRTLTAKPDGSAVALADLTGAANQRSSKYLLQSGAFNLNSVSSVAWTAALRAGRYLSTQSFTYLNLLATTGSAADTSTTTVSPAAAAFFRFPQTAQETYKATDTYVQSASSGTPATINVPLFRRGLRTLTATQIQALAAEIVVLLQQKHTASGPYRSVEEFLNPSSLFITSSGTGAQISLLEKAIEVTGLNSQSALNLTSIGTEPEFSSQWLTQADIMTTLAPMLFPRSDTFLIRAYGETVNPATAATESTAWCEAVVQRLPEPLQPASATSPTDSEYQTPPGTLGRRFKLISLRWLTSSDI